MSLKMYEEPKGPKNIIAIAAGKGGVGKSTITTNLALTLKRLGNKVGILDADIYGPSIRMMLPEDRVPTQRGDRIIPALAKGIEVISMAYFRGEHEAAVVRAPIANSVVTQFMHKVDWGELDYLLIDFPPGTGDVQLTLSQEVNLTGAVMVTTPQEVALLDVRKAMRMFDQVKVPVIGIVENMSYYQASDSAERVYLFGRDGGEKLARESGIPFLGQIPLDSDLCRCGDQGEVIFSKKESPSITAFESFANKFVEHLQDVRDQRDIVREIESREYSLIIFWGDGEEQEIRYSDLQKRCSCATCVDETTGQRILDEKSVDEDVKARRVVQVGRYAIRIEFTSGCSLGIYDFDMLRSFSQDDAKTKRKVTYS